jgi:hypothetical protein
MHHNVRQGVVEFSIRTQDLADFREYWKSMRSCSWTAFVQFYNPEQPSPSEPPLIRVRLVSPCLTVSELRVSTALILKSLRRYSWLSAGQERAGMDQMSRSLVNGPKRPA